MLLRKPRCYAEVYNDLDDEVVTLFRVLRDPASAERLADLLRLTPFARTEFQHAYEAADDPIERSRRLVIRSFMGFGSNAHASQHKGHRSTGFRASSSLSGTTPAHDWRNYPDALRAVVERMRGVVIECRPALKTILQHDRPTTLHYVDPPYLPHLRARGNRYDLAWRMYRHEMVEADHVALLTQLLALEGMVVLSGYPSALYDEALAGWYRAETETHADGARQRTEVLWINPAGAKALDARHRGAGLPLLGESA